MSGERKVILDGQQIAAALDDMVGKILKKNKDARQIALVGIHTCGVFLAKRMRLLIRERTGVEVPLGSLDINLYRDDWSIIGQSPVVKTTDIPFDVVQKHLVLVDDVIFTGRTIRSALDALMDYGRPRSVQLAVLVEREGRELPIRPDYVGMDSVVHGNENIQVLLTERDIRDEVVIEN